MLFLEVLLFFVFILLSVVSSLEGILTIFDNLERTLSQLKVWERR
jgi:hypothetical protein